MSGSSDALERVITSRVIDVSVKSKRSGAMQGWDGIVFVFVVALGIAVRVVAAPHCLVVLAVAFLVVFNVTIDVGRYK